jgi:adenylosuccinate synthase
MIKAIVGANWGDEGKGKITDMLAEDSDIVIRFQGGANAGHTIINNYGKFALHTLPSGVFFPHITNIVGNGVALDIRKLHAELADLLARGVPAPKLIVSERAQVVMPYHPLMDAYEEARLAGKSFGSTKSGIAPFYSDKFAKIGFQVAELFYDDILRERLQKVCALKNPVIVHLYGREPLDPEALFNEMAEQRELIRPYVGDAALVVQQALAAGRQVLLEGQLGTLKDPDFGIYPMVTSSHTLAAYGAVGVGVSPREIRDIICVTNAYSSAWARRRLCHGALRRGSGGAAPPGRRQGRIRRPPIPAGPAAGGLVRRGGHPSTAAASRAPRRRCSPPSTCWVTWTRSASARPNEIDGKLTERFPPSRRCWTGPSPLHTLPAGNAISGAAGTMPPCPPRPRPM